MAMKPAAYEAAGSTTDEAAVSAEDEAACSAPYVAVWL